MNLFSRLPPSLFCLLLAGAIVRADPPAPEPIKNLILPTFTADNHRSMLLRSSTALMLAPRVIQLDGMNLTVFSGDASNHVDSILLSPVARISLDEDMARGPGPVRLIQDDFELTGEEWTYDHAQKRISIARNVRVTFRSELKDLLK